MAAYTDPQATQQFADMLEETADLSNRDVEVSDGDREFLVPQGETLLVRDYETDMTYLITVKRVS